MESCRAKKDEFQIQRMDRVQKLIKTCDEMDSVCIKILSVVMEIDSKSKNVRSFVITQTDFCQIIMVSLADPWNQKCPKFYIASNIEAMKKEHIAHV